MTQLKEIAGPHTVHVPVTAMAGATTDNEQTLFVAPYNCTITGVKWLPSAAVTSAATNFSVLSVRNRKGDASGTALPAQRSYNTGNANSVAFVPEDMTLSATATDLQLAAGDALTAQMIHSGTGLVIPAGTLRISYQVR